MYRDRATDASHFTGLETAAGLAREHTSIGPPDGAVERLHRAQFGAFLQAEVQDPSDLGYLQVGWAIARWLLQHGDGLVMDAESGRWWTSEELLSWEAGGWPTGRRFLLEREVRFSTSIEETTCVVATLGLVKFGRPELRCLVGAEDVNASGTFATATIPGWVNETMEFVANRLALAVQLRPGDVLHHGSMSFDVERAHPGVGTETGSQPDALVIRR